VTFNDNSAAGIAQVAGHFNHSRSHLGQPEAWDATMDRDSASATPTNSLPPCGQPTVRDRRAMLSRLCQQEVLPFCSSDQGRPTAPEYRHPFCQATADVTLWRRLMPTPACGSFFSVTVERLAMGVHVQDRLAHERAGCGFIAELKRGAAWERKASLTAW
jgi:hypothetical protein